MLTINVVHILYLPSFVGASNEEVASQETVDDNNKETKEKRDTEGETGEEDDEEEEGVVIDTEVKHFPRSEEKEGETTSGERLDARQSTDPPESQFVHLGPSRNRYTILKDEF